MIMGYTHYFKFTKFITKEQMAEVAERVKDVFGTFPMVTKRLKGPYGKGEPIITGRYGISFNGDAERNEDYEMFAVDAENLEFHFCKTARRPYDLAVCLCLIVLKDNFGDSFDFSSDGAFLNYKEEDGEIISAEKNWAKARRLYNKYCRTHDMNIPNYRKWTIDG